VYVASLCLNFYYSVQLGMCTQLSLADISHAEYLFVDAWLILPFITVVIHFLHFSSKLIFGVSNIFKIYEYDNQCSPVNAFSVLSLDCASKCNWWQMSGERFLVSLKSEFLKFCNVL